MRMIRKLPRFIPPLERAVFRFLLDRLPAQLAALAQVYRERRSDCGLRLRYDHLLVITDRDTSFWCQLQLRAGRGTVYLDDQERATVELADPDALRRLLRELVLAAHTAQAYRAARIIAPPGA